MKTSKPSAYLSFFFMLAFQNNCYINGRTYLAELKGDGNAGKCSGSVIESETTLPRQIKNNFLPNISVDYKTLDFDLHVILQRFKTQKLKY
jgi:hypothetical protein